MTAIRSGIPTEYRNGVFRSRIEARWAAFFDLVGWSWVYEPLDTSFYIPDFLIQGPRSFFVEVGPCVSWPDYDAKSTKPDAAAAELGHDLLVVGVSPIANLGAKFEGLAIGWLGEYGEWTETYEDVETATDGTQRAVGRSSVEAGYSWGAGVWAGCWPAADHFAVYHEYQSFTHRPCADQREMPLGPRHRVRIEDLWAEAGTTSQWRP